MIPICIGPVLRESGMLPAAHEGNESKRLRGREEGI